MRTVATFKMAEWERWEGKMDWWTSMNKTDRQLIRYKKIKEANDSLPNVIYFAHDKGNNIDLLFLRGQEKDKRSDIQEGNRNFISIEREREGKRVKDSKKIEENFFLYFLLSLNWNIIENLFVIYKLEHGYHALFSEDRFKFSWQILYNLVWMT